MGTAIIIYILLLLIFLIISSFIVRHAIKFNDLSPSFKYVVITFGVIAVTVIVFSISLLFAMSSGNDVRTLPSIPTPTSNSGNLNF